MNTFTKLSAKTLIQLLAIAMITLTLFSCGGSSTAPITPPATDTTGDGSDDTTGDGTDDATDDGTDDTTGGGGDGTTPLVTTTISANAAKVSTLSALATGTPSQVNIYWNKVEGATSYKLYKSKTDLSGYQNASPTNLSMLSSTVTITTHTTNATTIILSGTQTVYFLVTAIKDGTESYTNAAQTAATAFTMPFLTVVSDGKVWMDRNLGASQTAVSSTDTLAYGDLYQWGRSADGHQIRNSASTDTIAGSVTPTHGQFIKSDDDWTTADSSGALRSAYWAKTDGSSICPTGFRVPTSTELSNELSSWSTANSAGAFASNLKWPVAGYRNNADAELGGVDNGGGAWSRTRFEANSYITSFVDNQAIIGDTILSQGRSVRCIKD